MSQGNQSYLRFSLEESVWFQRGQEVEELVSISLDPNITIHENDQYVTIRGSLDLSGEYKCQNDFFNEGNQDLTVQKWVQAVELREEGICEFSHKFPVDITIPSYRVRDLSEIDVLIETFDYLLPERSCLKLSAELNITGLYGDQAAIKENEVQEEDVFEFSHRTLKDEEEIENDSDFVPFEVEVRKEGSYFAEPSFAESSSYQMQVPEVSFAAYRSEVSPAPSNQGEAHPIGHENTPVGEETETAPEEESSESFPNMVGNFIKNKLGKKKSMSISEFLGRKEGEEHARLKVCIVQNGESVETLAQRYDISVLQLMKVNQLEPNQDVYEGQVLYVPNTVVKK